MAHWRANQQMYRNQWIDRKCIKSCWLHKDYNGKKKNSQSGLCMTPLKVATTAIPNQFEKRLTFIPLLSFWLSTCLLHFKPLQLRNCSLSADQACGGLGSSWLPTAPRRRLASDVEVQRQLLIVTRSNIISSIECNPDEAFSAPKWLTIHTASTTHDWLNLWSIMVVAVF